MKTASILLSLLCVYGAAMAQNNTHQDSTDVFFRHLKLNEITVTGLTGQAKLKELPTPVSLITNKELRQTAATNLIDAIAHEPGVSQLTTGSGISKPIIRGLGYNRIVTISDGVRQEGQQWGDEHGIEIDAANVGSVEILKGPASLMYGSDAMAGVLIFHPAAVTPLGEIRTNVSSEYQTNNGLFGYSVNFEGNQQGFVWNGRWSQKLAHAYKNKEDGYVPGSQFREQAASAMFGLNRRWGHSHLRLGYYQLTPGIVEGERDPLTGELEATTDNLKTYGRTLPSQQVYHYKAVWDNALQLSQHGQLKAIIGYQQNRRQEFEESLDEYELYFQLHTLSYDLRYTHSWDNGWKLSTGVGGMYQRSLNKGEEVLIPAYHLFDVGAFVTASRTFDRLTVSGGLRFDRRDLHSEALEAEEDLDAQTVGEPVEPSNFKLQTSNFKFIDFRRHFNGATGSVGAVYNMNERTNLRLNVSRGFRAPNLSELGSNGVHEGTVRYEVGNSQLSPEHSLQADLGVDFNSQYVSAQLALFANRIDNYIFAARIPDVATMPSVPDDLDGLSVYQYQQGDARLIGFEAGVDFHPVHCLHFGNTFSYVDARQLNQPEETRYLPMTPAPRWTSDVKWELTHNGLHCLNNSFLAFGLECYLRQSHYYMADDTETATPSYTLLNMSAGTDLLLRGRKVAELIFTVQNLTNRLYQSHLSRLKYTDVNALTGRQGVYNMGRNITIKLSMFF